MNHQDHPLCAQEVRGSLQELEGPASLLWSSQLGPGFRGEGQGWVGEWGVRGPGSCLSPTTGCRRMGGSHWHQDVGVAATAAGDIAEPLHHVPRHLAGAALEALVGKHGHPHTEEEAQEG